MKKIIALAMMLILLFSLAGCGEKIRKGSEPMPDFTGMKTFEFKPGEAETAFYPEEIMLENQQDFHYAVTWTPSGLLAEIGLAAEDGTEYTVQLKDGAAEGTLKEIPAGTYRFFVRNCNEKLNALDSELKMIMGTAGFEQ